MSTPAKLISEITTNILDNAKIILESLPVPLLAWNEKRVIQVGNEKARKLFGYDSLEGRDIRTIFPKSSDSDFAECGKVSQERTAYNIQAYCREGKVLYTDVSTSAYHGRDLFLVLATLRVKDESEIETSKDLLCPIAKKSPLLAFISCSIQGVVQKVACFDTTVLKSEFIDLKTDDNILELFDKDGREHIGQALLKLNENQGAAKVLVKLIHDWGDIHQLELTLFTTVPKNGVFIFIRPPLAKKEVTKEGEKSVVIPVNDFMPYMLHDVRTCANNILFATTFLPSIVACNERSNVIEILKESSQQLVRVISDFLDIRKLQEKKLMLAPQEVILEQIIDSILKQHEGYAKEYNINLKSEIASNIPRKIILDPLRLSQVLINLVSNAIKFSKPKGTGKVIVKASCDKLEGKEYIVISVIDEGIGIKKEQLKQIFEKYTQESGTTAQKFGGTGLGLTICKLIIELMQGSIDVISEEGKGATLIFKIPCILPPKKENASKETEESSTVEYAGALRDMDLDVLVVDDSKISRNITGFVFDKLGCKVSLAESIGKAMELFSSQKFGIVFMDYNIGSEKGTDCVRKMRLFEKEHDYQKLTPIVYCSAYDVSEKEIMETHADGKIVKPIAVSTIIDTCRKYAIHPTH